METTLIFGINLLVTLPTTCFQFGLQATRPLKDYPCNSVPCDGVFVLMIFRFCDIRNNHSLSKCYQPNALIIQISQKPHPITP